MVETSRPEMTNPDATLVVSAPAKVNLTLHILSKRSDGYHELDSVMQKVMLADSITLGKTENVGIHLGCPDSPLPEDHSNLVWKAAEAFFDEADLTGKCGVSIILEKIIPIAAGLGGGSSDAAAVLTGLNQLFQTNLTEKILLRLGKSLGADVPFFVTSYSAVRATGIGDKMKKHETLKDCSLLLVNPGFSVSTTWVYEKFTLTRTVKGSSLSDSRENENLNESFCPLHNDLESVTIEQYPEIQDIKDFLLAHGAVDALMSGSGPTVFGVFPDGEGKAETLRSCVVKLTEKYGQGVFVTRPLGSN